MESFKSPIRLFFRLAGIAVLLVCLGSTDPVSAQPVLGASNTALGGGGTAYLSGPKTTLWNPANLAISDQPGSFHLNIGHLGLFYEPVLSASVVDKQFLGFTDVYYPYSPPSALISQKQRNSILKNNYSSGKTISQHQTRADIILAGALWQRQNEAFSIVARARFASRIEVGRGWYSGEFTESDGKQVRDFTLSQQRNRLYELSFGYGRKFTFVNGLMPQLNKLYIGIAPKLVLAGPQLDMTYNARYLRPAGGNDQLLARQFSYRSSGKFSRATMDYQTNGNPLQAIGTNFNRSPELDISGYGMGFDFGLTYVIPLGDDFSTIATNPREAITTKSIRIAFSVNDIGMIRYNRSPLRMTVAADTSTARKDQAALESMYTGSAGQYLSYLDAASELPNPLLNSIIRQRSYNTLMPTSLNAGILLQYSRLKLMGDLNLGLNNTAFTRTKLALHLGLEARPVKPIPLRFGLRLASGLPTQLGVGTGIETRYFDVNFGSRLLIRSRSFTSEIVGGAFAGVQLHF